MSPGCAHELHRTGVAGDPASPIHRLDPRAKILGLSGITVVAVSTPLQSWPSLVACGLALLMVAALARVSAATLWSRGRLILPLVVFVAAFIPFMRGGEQIDIGPFAVSEAGVWVFVLLSAKAIVGTASAVLLGATTAIPDVLHGLERLRVPPLLIVIGAFMYRYLFVMADEMHRMRAALAARAFFPRHAGEVAVLGRIVMALSLRSYRPPHASGHAVAARIGTALLTPSDIRRRLGREREFPRRLPFSP